MKGCGYLDVEAGDVREESFSRIWFGSPLFNQLRDLSAIKGRCGACEYKRICGGCRARAYESTGDYLAAEPYCIYEPAESSKALDLSTAVMQLDISDRRLLNVIQTGFPLTEEPFADLAERLDTSLDEVIRRITRLKQKGIIRYDRPGD